MSVGTPATDEATVAPVLRLSGLHAATLEALREAVPFDPADACPWIVSDVSLGDWRGQQVATEFCAQLALSPPRLPLPDSIDFLPALDGEMSYADLIGHGIDAEALGDGVTLTAMDAVMRIAGAIEMGPPRVFLLLAPRYAISWEPEDLLFIRLLAPRLKSTGNKLILVCADPPVLPHDFSVEWLNEPRPAPSLRVSGLLGLMPGIVGPQVAASLKCLEPNGTPSPATLRLANGHTLIAPECRRSPGMVPKLEYDRLAIAARECEWLRAYAEFHGNNAFVEPQFLLREAWRRFSCGGSGAALRLLRRATDCSVTPLERAVVACHAQGMRIALRQFADAALAPDPTETAPLPLRSFLLRTKGYALVMSGDPQSAMEYFRREWRQEWPAANRESLYLLNISALAHLKLGDPQGALAIERDIESRAAALSNRDWHLEYITHINMARLHHRLGELEAAGQAYDLAFATTMGVRSESEAVYANLCAARLNTRRGYHCEAFRAWLRASLHWVAARVPEALAPRVVHSLLGSLPATPEAIVENVSQALLVSLARAARESPEAAVVRVTAADLDADTPVFIRADCLGEEAPDWALGGDGWSVLGSSRWLAGTTVPRETPSRRQLCALICRLLAGLSRRRELEDSKALIVDDRLGQEIPTKASELLESAIRLAASRLLFDATDYTLGHRERMELEAQVHVRLGNAVARVDSSKSSATVIYKRGRPAATVSREMGLLLRALCDCPSLSELSSRVPIAADSADLIRRLRALEESRIVYLFFPEELCIAAGISRHSKVN